MKHKTLVFYFLQFNFLICFGQLREINNLACEANFVSSLINAEQNETVTFSGTSTDSDSFSWNFTPNASPPNSTNENPQVSFNQIGATTVNLTVSSNDGCTDTVTNSGPNIVSTTQSVEDCWTIINNGIDIYNGQFEIGQSPGYFDPEIMDLTEAQGGFLTCGYYNEQAFASKYGVNYTNLQNKNGSYLAKHNYDGLLKWIVYTEKINYFDRDVMFSTVEDSNGDIYVSGHSRGIFYDNFGDTIDLNDSGTAGFIIKLDSRGKIIWHIKGNYVFPKRLHLDNNNNIVVSGDVFGENQEKSLYFNNIQSEVLSNLNNLDVNSFFLKLDSSGSLLWHTGINTSGPNSQFLEDIDSDGNNNLYLTGYCSDDVDIYSANSLTPSVLNFSGISPKLFLIKFDANGQLVWHTKSYVDNLPNGSFVKPHSMITDNAGNSYITGINRCFNSSFNQVFENADGSTTSQSVGGFFLAKINSNGICEWINGAAHSYYGYGYKVIKSGDEIIALGSVSNSNSITPIEEVEFLSTNGSNLPMSFYSSDYFLTVYDSEGNLKRVITNGINNADYFYTDRISGFFKDTNDNYYLSRNLGFFTNGPQTFQNFNHTIESSNTNGIDGTITKFTEDCGIVTYNTINQNVPNLIVCDNISIGSNTDGMVVLDLLQQEEHLFNGQAPSNIEISYFTDVTLINEINSPSNYQNTNITETIYVSVDFLTTQNSSLYTSFVIEVEELPIVSSIVEIHQCDDNLDGFSTFNLTETNPELSTNYLTETISFYESQLDAETNTNAITEPTIYTNQAVNTDVVWARIENENGCFATSQINLNISSTQIPNTFFRDFYECDAIMNQQDGISIFDFSSVDPEVQALFPAGQIIDISYYENLADAFSETNAILDISNYSNATPFTQDIFVRVENPLNNNCLGLGHYITLHVLEVPLVTGPIMMEQCDISGDGIELFDTSNIENELSLGQTGTVTFAYEDELGNTLSSPLPNPLSSDQAILNVFATMSFQDANAPNGGCSVQTTISFAIFNSITINTVPDFVVCDDDSDGQYAFDTSTIDNTILNGEIADVTYRDEDGIVLTNPLPNPFITGTQTLTATVTEPSNPMCFTDVEINFIVNNQPIANVVQDDFVCDDASNDGEYFFNLTDYNSQVLNGQPSTLFSISYHVSQTDSETNNNPLPSSYLSTVNSETIFVRIESNNSTSCFDTTSFQIGVSYMPIANQPEDFNMCDAGNDGIEVFNLSIMDDAILNGESNAMFTVSYYESQQDADLNNNPFIGSYYISSVASETIFVRLENNLNTNCFSTTQFSIIINEQPVLNMEDTWSICKGEDSIELEADEGYDNYLWSTGETTRIITVLNPGAYTITASNTYQNFICDVTKTINVAESNVATITNIETIDWSQNNNAILVEVGGGGDYEYSLDGLTYQDSNQFNNLIIDDYTVYVRDKNGCGVTTKDVYLLFYPNYFTPNGDTFHDTWQIYNGDKEPNSEIYIFDRYGKLLTQIKTSGLGWDGIVNGKLMPTSDYWFLLKRQNGKEYRGHFTLRR